MALVHYLLLGIFNRRLLILVVLLYTSGLLSSSFILELAMINRQAVAAAFLADFLRYSLVLLVFLLIITQVAEDFEQRQLGWLLAMPVSRWQYILAQFIVTAITAFILVLPSLFILVFYAPADIIIYWTIALWLEVLIIGLVGLLSILSLEKVPPAVLLTLAIYLLSKLSGLINQMLAAFMHLSEDSFISRLIDILFAGILFLLPGLDSFAQNDVYFKEILLMPALFIQFQNILADALLIFTVCAIDLYRKEFYC